MVVTGVESSDSDAAATTRAMTAACEAALKPMRASTRRIHSNDSRDVSRKCRKRSSANCSIMFLVIVAADQSPFSSPLFRSLVVVFVIEFNDKKHDQTREKKYIERHAAQKGNAIQVKRRRGCLNVRCKTAPL